MKGKKSIIIGIILVVAISVGAAGADMAVPVSPGGGTEVSGQNCPTFSWSAATGASSYEVEVYEQVTAYVLARDIMRTMGYRIVAKEIPAPALSWTPSTGECLSRGISYVWYVRGVDAGGEGQWSEGLGFQVEAAALSIEQKEAVQEVVQEYLSEKSSEGETTTNISKQSSTADVMTPMSYEGTTNSFFGNGAGDITTGNYNTFIGAYAGYLNTTGHDNSFIGYGAGVASNAGNFNSFIGSHAGYQNLGSNNSFIGYRAGNANTTGHDNNFIGFLAGYQNISGNYNTVLGVGAGYSSSTGYRNVFLGYLAGFSETGSNKLYIDNCYTGGSCTQPFIKGDFAARTLQIDGSLTLDGSLTFITAAAASDIRYKKDIHPLKSSLEKVLELKGVTYEWDKDQVYGAGFKEGRQIGLIAQEVEKVLPELVHTDSNGYKALSYDKLGPVLIEAVKEQQKEIKEKDARIKRLEKAIENIERRLASLENPSSTLALK